MKKNYLFIGATAIMMAGCASDDLVGDENISSGETPIAFSMNTPNATRGTENGKYTEGDAATKLNNVFYVWGEKNEGETGHDHAKDLVFKNYTVSYTSGSENTTTSNTKGWEYVGLSSTVSNTNLSPETPTSQSIKYWDKDAKSYTFTAVSAVPTDITGTTGNNAVASKVKIEKITGSTSVLDDGYYVTIKDLDAAGNVYVSDRVNIAQAALTTGNPENAYGGYVKFTFRKFQSKIRFGIYETVPGYKVVITGLKYTTKAADASTKSQATVVTHTSSGTEKTFGVTGDFVAAGDNTKYTVTYETATANNNLTVNRAKFNVGSSTKQTYCTSTGTNWLSTEFKGVGDSRNKTIGEYAKTPTWDKGTAADGSESWTPILPNPQNTTPLTLEISYDLYSEDTGEKIAVDYKTVKVPAEYCQWKPNYAYTYLFKISDKTADLYPITFDACVVTEETGNQETITEVSEPSITTFGVKSNKIVTKENEYAAGDDIYATVLDGSSIATLTTSGTDKCINLYTVTTTDASKCPISEASVANAIKNSTATSGPIKYETVTIKTSGEDSPILTTTVPTEDGKTITLANSGNALKWTAETGKTYAIEYIKDANTKYYKIVKIASDN